MVKIEMYSTASCPYCVRARRLLNKKGAEFEEIRIDQDPSQEAVMIQRSERFTVPQIFIDGRHIGGYDDMAELDMDDRLDPLLRGEDPT
ncbi:Glutaredoxin-3 [Thiorhodovibrio winogradskyi]|uniref:Glutaredoxin n=1 Tax=Thiorhodovibrio winogradskyi TaxID=77007 RepID=A0ABZ0SFE6_9GAMM|nr:glutaredoxin 3 [Thiorhodovibrio winogradskyi]